MLAGKQVAIITECRGIHKQHLESVFVVMVYADCTDNNLPSSYKKFRYNLLSDALISA